MTFMEAIKCVEQDIEVYIPNKSENKRNPRLKIGPSGVVYWSHYNNRVTYPKLTDITSDSFVARINGSVCYTMQDVIDACLLHTTKTPTSSSA